MDDFRGLASFEKLLASWSNIQLFEKVFTYMETLVWGKSFMVKTPWLMIYQKNVVFHPLSSTILACHWCQNTIGDGNVKTLVDEIKLSEVLF